MKETEPAPERGRACRHCDGPIPPETHHRRKFCSDKCRGIAWRIEHPERNATQRREVSAKQRKKVAAHKVAGTAFGVLAYKRSMLSAAKSRAKRAGLPFNLTTEDIQIPDVCPVLGIEIKFNFGQPSDNSPSLDKIVPSLGYTRGNCEVISHRANMLKSNATVPEMEAIYHYYSNKISNTDWMVPNGKT